jgi:DNA-binding response OmpR family regulator
LEQLLSGADAPKLAIIDWIMPGLSGPDLCRRIRSLLQPEPPYLIILTNLDGQENIVGALQAGADDFIHKPFDAKGWRRAARRVTQPFYGKSFGNGS